MERLRTFTNHPFKVIGDSQMIELQDSIKKYGVLNPLTVRPRKEGYYEIISGHRRKYAAERLGYKKIPVIMPIPTPKVFVVLSLLVILVPFMELIQNIQNFSELIHLSLLTIYMYMNILTD